MNDIDLISIIVPVYNVENYLSDCLDSIIQQTYHHLEIIVIDDGSTDNSSQICDTYALRDQRIVVFHQQNQGLGPARNKGISLSHGKFLFFVDSDDYIHSHAIEILHGAIMSNETLLAIGNFRQVTHCEVPQNITDYETFILSQKELIKCFYGSKSSQYENLQDVNFTSVWSKLYKKELLDNLSFRNMYYEDVAFSMAAILKVPRASYVNAPLYFWLQRPTSITHKPMNKKRLDVLAAYKFSVEQIPKTEKDNRGHAVLRLFKLMLTIRLLTEQTDCRDYAKQLIKALDKAYRLELLTNETILLKDRITVLVMYSFPLFYKIMINFLEVISKVI